MKKSLPYILLFLMGCNPYGEQSVIEDLPPEIAIANAATTDNSSEDSSSNKTDNTNQDNTQDTTDDTIANQPVNIPFAVAIEQASTTSDPAYSFPIEFNIVFANTPINFTKSDITFTGTAQISSYEITGSDKNFTLKIMGLESLSQGTIIPSIQEEILLDANNNSNLLSTSSDNSVTISGPVLKLSCGPDHNCVLLSSGIISCFGDDSFGQSTVNSSLTNIGSAKYISAGGKGTPNSTSHSCGINNLDQVQCFGSMSDPNGVELSSSDKVISLEAGYSHYCGIKDDFSTVCWGGLNFFDESSVPASLQLANSSKAISAGANHSCAIAMDDTANCWGTPQPQTTVPSDLGKIKSITTGALHTCALKIDGSVRCWGDNAYGQTTILPNLLQVAGSTDKISSNINHTCAVTSIGTVECWGDPSYNKLVAPSALNDSSKAVKAVDVCTGYNHSCALTTTGKLVCWGDNSKGQLDIPLGL